MNEQQPARGYLLFSVVFLCLLVETAAQQGCDKVFSGYPPGAKSGEFQSPGFPSHYPNGVSCKYKFVGVKGKERVKIKFTAFDLQGRRPSCTNDYVNIYSQLSTESDNLLGAQLTGPFCGEGTENLPSLLLSTKHILVIWFYSNDQRSHNGFRGTYEFVAEGTKLPSVSVDHGMSTVSPDLCAYTMTNTGPHDTGDKEGSLISPTYPGVYPDNTFCSYTLKGKPGERIRLTFEDFSLFYGGEYCPFDYLWIYDGEVKVYKNEIGKFCGNYNRSTVIYSTNEFLRLEFTTGQDRIAFKSHQSSTGRSTGFASGQRGFNITYTFSKKFVKLDNKYIKPGSQHIRGTQCDLRMLSGKETNGTFVSPNYPLEFPPDVVCRYYLDGLMDEQNLEKVMVNFYHFAIPGNMPYCLLGYLGENEDGRLGDGSVTAKYCDLIHPPEITSEGPRLVLTLNTTGAQSGGKFMANYRFITDYGIDGHSIYDGKCKYHYKSSVTKEGFVNSPRHPQIYPVNTDCEYIFIPLKNEMVLITFTVFVVSDQAESSHNTDCDVEDYVAFYEKIDGKYRLTEKYCRQTFPGPYATSRELKLVFHSNKLQGYAGFKAEYTMIETNRLDKDGGCTALIDTKGIGGVIKSPKYPSTYPALMLCTWTLHASQPDNRILVELSDVNLEGVYGSNNKKSSCSYVALRLYNSSTMYSPVDLICGKKLATDSAKSFMSYHDSFKITFITSASSLGATGFKISWTEIHTGASTMSCTGFQCAKNRYCIAPTLKCNNEPNCGLGDNSDETAECPNSSGVQILHIAIGTSISSFFCIILLICGFYHRRKFRGDRAAPDHDHVEVRYVSAPTGCNTTDRLLMEDRNDGNGNMGNDNHNNSSAAATTTQSPRCQKVSMV